LQKNEAPEKTIPMIARFESIIRRLFKSNEEADAFSIFDPQCHLTECNQDAACITKALNAAFLISLAGAGHNAFYRATRLLERMTDSAQFKDLANFYLSAKRIIHREIEAAAQKHPSFKNRFFTLSERLADLKNIEDSQEASEMIWSVFFPEGAGILKGREERIRDLRAKRTVTIRSHNLFPLNDPGRQILFTSNVLLTVPDKELTQGKLSIGSELAQRVHEVCSEQQLFWYDHPIQIGAAPDRNEALYGLKGLDEAVEYERSLGNMSVDAITCTLSVSVTHEGLRDIAGRWLEQEILRRGGLKNIRVYLFTETDAKSIIKEVLAPAARHYLGSNDAEELLSVFGVDGEYGRHYSFLKAISAFWNVLVDKEIKSTFKIDLDQVFPQEDLVAQTGLSAFEHLKTSLWGAHGIDSEGSPVELGMIAGALVNQSDIMKSVFTPDVVFPDRTSSMEGRIFFSALTQALSTEAEMMTRYNTDMLDGKKTCIKRIHVTGGTNGILVEALRRHRPFTPSFIGRAEDQAYILSVLSGAERSLAYVHKDGLIMRHDNENFSQKAISSSASGKLVGDYIRTLFFSEYARVLDRDIERIKHQVDPFTGCFISLVPATVVLLRFCLRAASLFEMGEDKQGIEFITMGSNRIQKSLDFVEGDNSPLKQCYERERIGYDLYFDVLTEIEKGLKDNDGFAFGLKKRAEMIIRRCLIT
jgi:hypothetical protein